MTSLMVKTVVLPRIIVLSPDSKSEPSMLGSSPLEKGTPP
jgi:hypothetical protein